MMGHRSRVWLALVPPTVLLAGCVTAGNMSVAPSTVAVAQKEPLSVAVIIPEQSRNLSLAVNRARGGLEGGSAPGPLGDNFEKTIQDRLSRMYEKVVVIRSPYEAKDADAIFEATLNEVSFTQGCLIAPFAGVGAQGTFRALAADGRELWRSGRTENRHDFSGMMATLELGPDFSRRIAALVDDWAGELKALAVATYAPGAAGTMVASTPAPARPGAGRAASGFPTRPVPVSFGKGAPRPDDVAVIIGNADYGKQGKDIPNVLPAYADAEGAKRYAVDALGIREGNVIFLKDATGAQLTRVFGNERDYRGQLHDWVKPGRSRVFVYYAGHGAPAVQGGSPYLVPADADAARIELNGFALKTLYDNLGKLPAESVTVVLEACFSGVSQGGSVIASASPVFAKVEAPKAPAKVTVIAAGAADQIASWEEDKSHGLFTKYFLLGQSGEADKAPHGNRDGTVSLDELQRYLADTLTYYARRYYGRDQTAQVVKG